MSNTKISQIIFALGLIVVFNMASLSHAAVDCSRVAGSMPFVQLRPGVNNPNIPIEHIIVMMQENHSFDNYFGNLNKPQYYGNEVDGIAPGMSNLDSKGHVVPIHHETSLCAQNPQHSWDAMHDDWDMGKNDRFVINSGTDAIGYYDDTDLNFYYALANRFAISDRYFSPILAETFPNRYYMLTGTSFGHIKNEFPVKTLGYRQKLIFDSLNEAGISWKYYRDGVGYLYLFTDFLLKNLRHTGKVKDFEKDIKANKLPQVIFIDSDMDGEDEHPSGNIQNGEIFVSDRIHELVESPYWKNSVIFLTYDEGGGFFDHVSPPEVCAPDNISPIYYPTNTVFANFDRDGFRVPFVTVSPYAKTHFVSHVNHDHTSILKFIETKFNLPALTNRDANADDLLDMFDFAHPNYDVNLPAASRSAVQCKGESKLEDAEAKLLKKKLPPQ